MSAPDDRVEDEADDAVEATAEGRAEYGKSERVKAEEPPAESAKVAPAKPDTRPRKPVNHARRLTIVVLMLSMAYFVVYVLSDRFTPYTEFGRIDGFVVPVVPQVSGYLTEMNVELHDVVEEGAVLARVNPEPFEIAVRSAQASLEGAGQSVGAQTAGIEAAVGRLGVARAQLDRSERTFQRVERINARNPGALSQADRDRADTSLAQSQSKVISAEADLEKARTQLGPQGADNPAIKAAVAALDKAEFDLAMTTLYAPFRGGIESLRTDVGQFAPAGQPLMTFVSTRDVWVVANMRENNLGNIEVGDRAEVVLDVAPGHVFTARVSSISFGVTYDGAKRSPGELPTAASQQGWLRDPQRFPVILHFDESQTEDVRGFCRVGGQANVVVYTESHATLDAIGRFRIRLASWLSYVR